MSTDEFSVHLSLRGIGAWLVTEYLKELGGQEMEPGLIAGAGWQASVTVGQPVYVGSIRLGVTEVAFSGEKAAVEAVRVGFEKKALRAGG